MSILIYLLIHVFGGGHGAWLCLGVRRVVVVAAEGAGACPCRLFFSSMSGAGRLILMSMVGDF